jgi:hypothetical protein
MYQATDIHESYLELTQTSGHLAPKPTTNTNEFEGYLKRSFQIIDEMFMENARG